MLNPQLPPKYRPPIELGKMADGILAGEISALAQGITLIESNLPAHRDLSDQLLQRCLPYTGKSFRIGISGVPGVGKSTFVESFGQYLLDKDKDARLAVLAVDPSSQEGKGSILGDKTRMERLGVHARAFIRPSPAGKTLGGVANHTRETILLCEAAGYNRIFVETVGVGQSETAVQGMTDCFLLLLLPGGGDELQGIKRGIMEMADLVVVNKADINPTLSNETRNAYANALHLFPAKENGWIPEAIQCAALTGMGINDVSEAVERYFRHQTSNGYLPHRRGEQGVKWLHEGIQEALLSQFYHTQGEKLSKLEAKVSNGEINIREALRELGV